ncbi:adenosylcobinamide-phosphate synthase CbiB [Metabacillus halosaccharovorans]|uniref:adenosylcobinamide-phosphate synthase CbiB n=1 Tax=Metabacillus halosaccharovorans TaxID=930124 RepID=UPI0034CF6F8E
MMLFNVFSEYLLLIIAAGIILDFIIGDPRWLPHPVVIMGKLISFLEKKWNHGEHRVQKGLTLTLSVILVVFLVTSTVLFFAYKLHPVLAIILEIYLISTTIAIKGLSTAAKEVLLPLKKGDIIGARKQLSMIVGRDTLNLPEKEIVRGTVETVAENTVDGITAPLFWAIIGGAPFALVYRAINTLDSMVGYKDERYGQFGWASAKLDDLANWIPARLTAVSIWISSLFIKGSKVKQAWKITLRDARKHPSPNSGWSEAMVAGLLGVQLGGINYYKGRKSERATMGDPEKDLTQSDIPKAIKYMHGGWIVFVLIAGIIIFVILS